MKKVLLGCLVFILFFAVFCVARFCKDNMFFKNYIFEEHVSVPSKEAVIRFSGGLKIKTVSNPDYSKTDFKEFVKFINYIKKSYPYVFGNCEFKLINNYSIVLKLKGKDSDSLPNILIAHYDVVDAKNEAAWKYPPFSGYFDDEFIYSRGTIDDKGSVFAILEALNGLIKDGFKPRSDLYIAFSHTEETGSDEGAPKIVNYFRENNIRFNSVLDEGGMIINEKGNYYAFVGTAEKGRLLSKITVFGEAAHASTPPENAAVLKLAKLIKAFSGRNDGIIISKDTKEYYKTTYRNYDLPTRFLISNMDILRPFFVRIISNSPDNKARVSSTFAITIIEASSIQNAVSSSASMLLDARMLPEKTTEDLKIYVDKVIKRTLPGENVKVEYLGIIEPSFSHNGNNDEYEKLSRVIRKLYPDILISPDLILGATDARVYNQISDNTFRFLPCILSQEEAILMHVDNEKISIKNWGRMITFYREYMLTK